MDTKKLVKKFINDTIKIEEKLIKIRAIPREGSSYRNLVSLYKDSIQNIETYLTKDCDSEYFEDFYIERRNIISNELTELEIITNKLLNNDDFREYKMYNQSFQDLAKILDDVEKYIRIHNDKNKYNRLLNYRNENSFIDKNLLLESVKYDNLVYPHRIISVDFGGDKSWSVMTLSEVDKIKRAVRIDNIKSFENVKTNDIYNYIKKECKNNDFIDKILIMSVGMNRGLIDLIEEDEVLKDKLVQIANSNANMGNSINNFKNAVSYHNIIFKDRVGHNFQNCINKEILLLFNEIQNLKIEECVGRIRLTHINKLDGVSCKRLICILNYYSYISSEILINEL